MFYVLLRKELGLRNIIGGKKEVSYITRIINVHTGVPEDIIIEKKIIKV